MSEVLLYEVWSLCSRIEEGLEGRGAGFGARWTLYLVWFSLGCGVCSFWSRVRVQGGGCRG